MDIFNTIITTLGSVLSALDWAWYVLAFVIAFHFAKSCWGFWREEMYKSRIKWALLEIQIPRETTRGPKAMEQVLASVFNLRNAPVGPKETYLDGEITRWFSFEVVGMNNVTKFYLRLPALLIHPFVSSFYAQYPEIEIVEAEGDYIYTMPPTYQELRKKNFDLYGIELVQRKPPHFGINTYIDFEPKVGNEKGRIIDSMASILEIIGRMKPEEVAWVQYVLIPDTKEHWVRGAKHEIDKLKSATQGGDGGGGDQPIRFRFRTQGEEKTLKRIEEKKGKAAYETIIRMIYIAPKTLFNQDLLNRGIFGSIAQFNNDDQSFGKPDKLRTKVEWNSPPFFWPRKRLYWKQVKIYDEYRRRFIPEETFMGKLYNSHIPWVWCFFHKPMIFSAEEIATLFHIPTNVVMTQVTMDRIESRRLSPPWNLPQ